ncbi:hypothetical protein DFH07DRAFT_959662 [Mycena maculata]|uniref:DUF6535 domain-containing protein n=1 Tax=Mycena maculata TaxID=230809 RepID=A0AAD7J2V9_9AGAR|nr:hypothetical protein DFH07DRAFT_959662 [Mycena maculata]
MRSAPIVRARIFSFLYYGLKPFNMPAVMEVIPLLLHASLIFFFMGLVAFLFPVNGVIMILSAFILALMAVIYAALTMSVVNTSDYSLTVKNSSSASFKLFHAADGGGGAHTTSRPPSDLAPGGEGSLAWDSRDGQVSSSTSIGHLYYSFAASSDSPARVWGVQLNGYTPSGERPKTLYQYAASLYENSGSGTRHH